MAYGSKKNKTLFEIKITIQNIAQSRINTSRIIDLINEKNVQKRTQYDIRNFRKSMIKRKL